MLRIRKQNVTADVKSKTHWCSLAAGNMSVSMCLYNVEMTELKRKPYYKLVKPNIAH